MAYVFISYRSLEPDAGLAKLLHQAVTQAGHEAFLASETIQVGDWSDQVDEGLERCDYFVLLLSERAAESDMVREEVRRSRELRHQRQQAGELVRPMILPIRVAFPRSAPLGYALRSYLEPWQQLSWESAEDTPGIVEKILEAMQRDAAIADPTSAGEPRVAEPLGNGAKPGVSTPSPKPSSTARRDRYTRRLAVKQAELDTVDAQLEETIDLMQERKLEVRAERLLEEIEALEGKLEGRADGG